MQAAFHIISGGTYEMECAFSSRRTDGIFPPVTDILLDILLHLLSPCNEKDSRRCVAYCSPPGKEIGSVIHDTDVLCSLVSSCSPSLEGSGGVTISTHFCRCMTLGSPSFKSSVGVMIDATGSLKSMPF